MRIIRNKSIYYRGKMETNNLYKKKVVLLTEAFDEGGTEVAMLALIQQLQKFECEIDILCISKTGILLDKVPPNIPIEEIVFKNNFWKKIALNIEPQWERPEMWLYNLFTIYFEKKYPKDKGNNKLYKKMLKKTLPQKKEWDILFDFYGYGSFLTAYAAKSIRATKKATWVHATFVYIWDKVAEYFEDFQKIFCVSQAALQDFRERFPETEKQVEILYNFTDVNEIIRKSKEQVEDIRVPGKYIFLTIGRLERVKSIDFSIRVAKKLKMQKLDFVWYVIGDGSLYHKLQDLINQLNLEKDFILLGRRDNVCPYLKQCDFYIQTSASEGYSTTILEARALKRIVIATDIKSNREQIISGKTGYLVKHEEKLFADMIEYVIAHRDEEEYITKNLLKERIEFWEGINTLKNF